MRVGLGRALLLLPLVLPACTRDHGSPTSTKAVAPAPPPPAAPDKLPWIDDDYGAALAQARAAHLPIVVDLWAPWCHSCLSMQATVLVDPSVRALAGRFVWLALDGDKAVNAPALAKLPAGAWPTYYVLSSVDESIQARQVGSCSVAQLRELLAAGEAGHQDLLAAKGGLPASTPLARVREGDRAAARGDFAAADQAYGAALAAAPPEWARAPDVLVRQIMARDKGGDARGCAELGEAAADRALLGATASAADFATTADGCATALGPERAAALRAHLLGNVVKVVDDDRHALSVDDAADALRIARELADELGDPTRAHQLAERELALLDRAAAATVGAYAAMTYNFPRAEVYTYLGRAADLIPELERSVAALPKEYDPPYRLASLYRETKQLAQAQAMAVRALTLIYGPRRGRALGLLADIQHDRGDLAGERQTRAAMVDLYAQLPPGQQNPTAEADARAALAALPTAVKPKD